MAKRPRRPLYSFGISLVTAAMFCATQSSEAMERKDYHRIGRDICSTALNSLELAQQKAASEWNLDAFDAGQFGAAATFLTKDKKLMIVIRSNTSPASVAESCSFYFDCDENCGNKAVSGSDFGPSPFAQTYDQNCKIEELQTNKLPKFSDAQLVVQTLGTHVVSYEMTCVLYN